MSPSFTRQQNIAINLDKHIAVTANAGSGKTRILVERYLRILKDSYSFGNPKVTPYEIVAITFTRKAATEMQYKILKEIEEEKKTADKTNQVILSKIINDMSSARIATIDSFASSILREFALEADVNPNFIAISESQTYKLKKETFEYLFSTAYQEKEHYLHNELLLFTNRYNIDTLEKYVNYLYLNKNYLSTLEQQNFYNNKVEIVKLYKEEYRKYLHKFVIEIFCKVYEAVNEYQSEKPKFIEFNNFLNKHNDDIKFNKNLSLEFLLKIITTFKEAFSGKMIGNSGLGKYLSDSSGDLSFNLCKSKCTEKIFDITDFDKATEVLVDDASFLFEFGKEYIRLIDDEKQRNAYLYFDDILIKTNEVLSKTEVADKIRAKIKILMVDEFQDTNPIQFEIIEKICPGLFDNSISNSKIPQLFIVGDEKQSIYGFRGADVRIIKEATEKIKDKQSQEFSYNPKNKQFVKITEDEIRGDIKLNASFRMYPTLALFINNIFNILMCDNCNDNENENLNKYKANHSPIISNADSLIDDNIIDVDAQSYEFGLNERLGQVEFLVSENKEQASDALAISIKELLNNSKCNPSDICILARDTTKFSFLMKSLTEYEIPFLLHSSKGFFQTVEVKEVLSVLSFLNNTKNNYYLLEALKSSFFAFDDNDIYQLVKIQLEENHNDLWSKLQYLAKSDLITTEFKQKVNTTVDLILYFLRITYRMSIPKLIRTILAKTDWIGKITPFKDKNQRIVNLYKLIDFAREFEKQGFLNIYDFINEIETLISISTEGVAPITAKNAVNIMTIHSSKGLEFPIVYLYNTEKDYSNTPDKDVCYCDEKSGIIFKSNVITENRKIKLKSKNYASELVKDNTKIISEFEENRLLYVALTRAIKKLVICAPIIKNYAENQQKLHLPANSYIKDIFKFYSPLLENIENLLMQKTNTTKIFVINNQELTVLDSSKNEIPLKNIDLKLTISIYNSLDNKNTSAISSNEFVQELNEKSDINLDNITGSEKEIFFSATKLATFIKDNKDKYLYEYILEMNDFLLDLTFKKFDEDSSIIPAGKEVGTLIHSVFENLDRWFDKKRSEIYEDNLLKCIDECISINNLKANKDIIDRVLLESKNVTCTKLFREERYDLESIKNEFILRYAFGENFITGIIDVLIKNCNGNYEIWDYKSDFVTKESILEKALEYEAQMNLYAYLIYLYDNKPKSVSAKLLFTRLAKNDAEDSEWTHTFTWTADALEKYEITLNETISKIYAEFLL